MEKIIIVFLGIIAGFFVFSWVLVGVVILVVRVRCRFFRG